MSCHVMSWWWKFGMSCDGMVLTFNLDMASHFLAWFDMTWLHLGSIFPVHKSSHEELADLPALHQLGTKAERGSSCLGCAGHHGPSIWPRWSSWWDHQFAGPFLIVDFQWWHGIHHPDPDHGDVWLNLFPLDFMHESNSWFVIGNMPS